MFDAVFSYPGRGPDIATLKECVAQGGLDDKWLGVALTTIRGWERQERERRRCARYLRHYRRIAQSLS